MGAAAARLLISLARLARRTAMQRAVPGITHPYLAPVEE
jgi:hypothetical protein